MNLPKSNSSSTGSVLIIVLWIAFGLVGLALYFADSTNFELRASDNRVSAEAADEAIEGAARYITRILTTQIANGSNGAIPGLNTYVSQAVAVGDCHFWLLGRDITNTASATQQAFGLIDESSRLNLNTVSSNTLYYLPRMTLDVVQSIMDWRDTNGSGPTVTYYSMLQPAYLCKCDPFETVDELRLLNGTTMDILVGEDPNRNGLLDPNETDENQNRQCDPGLLEWVTTYSREPNTNRIDISSLTQAQARSALTNLDSSRIQTILGNLGFSSGGRGGSSQTVKFGSPLQFYARSQMTATEFAQVATNLTTTNGTYFPGRVNVNTASLTVLTALVAGDTAAAQQLMSYRNSNPTSLGSIAWVYDALNGSYSYALTNFTATDNITTQSYQFCADVAALGPNGRGYRRVKFIFDTSSGIPQIVYRQDLTHLGWALGQDVRRTWFLAKGTQ
jgi:type II secretory pathway component PulK